jgi:5'-nucleotidase
MGRIHYWFTVVPIEMTEEGTDRWAVDRGFISMTPLRLDLTNEVELTEALVRHPVEYSAGTQNLAIRLCRLRAALN